MTRIVLPAPGSLPEVPFADAAGARAWLKAQPQAEPLRMQAGLLDTVQGIDASSGLPPTARAPLLDALRGAVILAQGALEGRYARKPLPLPPADQRVFDTACRLWRTLAVAYLRAVPALPPAEAAVSLHRAAVTLRTEQSAYFMAAAEVPPELPRLLHGVLCRAEELGVQRQALPDPEYRQYGESNIAGHVAWAWLLAFADPYRLTPAQLAVANRALGRWREMAGFPGVPDDSSKARCLPLAALVGAEALAEDGPRWLDVRPVTRKIRHRIESLRAGETPEALKLGRELSSSACLRLLDYLDARLRPERFSMPEQPFATGTLQLAFGPEAAYALLAGRSLRPATAATGNRAVDHQRMAIFGFDPAEMPAGGETPVETELWRGEGEAWLRAPDDGARLSAPCLAARPGAAGGKARLGVLRGLQSTVDGRLRGWLEWYPAARPDSFRLIDGQLAAAFLVDGETPSVILAGGARPVQQAGIELVRSGPLALGPVLERGSDFVRHAIVRS